MIHRSLDIAVPDRVIKLQDAGQSRQTLRIPLPLSSWLIYFQFSSGLIPLILGLTQVVEATCSTSPTNRIVKAVRRYTGANSTGNFSSNVYQTDFEDVTWDEDNWLLSTTNLEQGQFETRGSVANGYLGINVASAGPFFEVDSMEDGGDGISGWPLFSRRQSFATISGFFDSQANTNSSNYAWLSQYGWDSVISGVPHWSGLILDAGDGNYLDATVDNSTISNFRTTYDFKAGVLAWSYKWTPQTGGGSYDITYRLFAHKLYINQAFVDMQIVSSVSKNVTVVNLIDGRSAVRSDFVDSGEDNSAIYSAVSPNGVGNVTAYIYANVTGSPEVNLSSRKVVTDKPYISKNNATIAQSVTVNLKAGKPARIQKFVGGASTDAFQNPQTVAKKAAFTALNNGYAKSLRTHIAEWANVMPDDSVDSYAFPNGTLPDDTMIIDSAVIAVANTYYLLQNTVGNNAINASSATTLNTDSISVGGLASDSYAGQVFWDADIWMQPGLTLSHPEAAQRITNYRVKMYEQAQENIKTSYAGSQNQTQFSSSSAIFPWTSGRYGNCTATGPCWDYQYHLNGDIGLSFINQWVTTGDTKFFKTNLFPIYDSVATLYSDLLKPNGSYYTVTNMTDPVSSIQLWN